MRLKRLCDHAPSALLVIVCLIFTGADFDGYFTPKSGDMALIASNESPPTHYPILVPISEAMSCKYLSAVVTASLASVSLISAMS